MLFFFHGDGGGGAGGEGHHLMYGVQQIDKIHLEILGLFTSLTDKACLGDLAVKLNKYF